MGIDLTNNILKVRDDHVPSQFVADGEKIKMQPGSEAPWASSGNFGRKELRNHIEPWLTAPFQSEHLSLLIGSGITHAVHRIATNSSAHGMDRSGYSFGDWNEKILAAADKEVPKVGRAAANIEDDLRIANERLLKNM